ncbi:MAG TPA: 6-carboxytetrahydropterin synthase [Gemmatimonadota bacterium]|nr:6-carboxytetrahydropterin synthase [Gemmatimonadota bacterium]
MTFRCAVRASYDAALYIPGDEGPGGRTHGHGYTVEAVLESDELNADGFVVDFERIQPRLEELADELDHRLLNELEPFRGATPSAERQAEYFYHRLSATLRHQFGTRLRVLRVRVTQEPDAWAEFEP